MDTLRQFTNLYQVSKTLRFELIPVGKTLENIEAKGVLNNDEQRANDYKAVKKIIDEYHKDFISRCLKDLKLKMDSDGKKDSLSEYLALASKPKRTETEEDEIKKVKDCLRKQIADAFAANEDWKDLFKKELVQKRLPEFVSNDAEKKRMVESFANFTTYFSGFHKNRNNMYSSEEKATAIAYRLIHENLPKFIDNMRAFEVIAQSPVAEHFADIEKSFSEYLNVEHLSDMFKMDYYSDVLTQEQIDVYNSMIGGRTINDSQKIQGINEYVNLYNQKQERKDRLPLLKPLYKLILSDREDISWRTEEFNSDEDLVNAINSFMESVNDILAENGERSITQLLGNIGSYNLDEIYITNDASLTDLSQQIFGQYDVFTSHIKKSIRAELLPTLKPSSKELKDPELLEKRINSIFKSSKSFCLSVLDEISHSEDTDDPQITASQYFATLGSFRRCGEKESIIKIIEYARIASFPILNGNDGNISQSQDAKNKIKNLLDSLKELQHFITPLLGNGDEVKKDNAFYAQLQEIWEALANVTPLYNKVRNWLTRKPYSTEKIKLNFENAQLLGGWDVNKEPDCTSVLLRKDGIYYLAIMDKKFNHTFALDKLPNEGQCFEKIDYKLLPGPNKMLPKVFFSKSRIKEFNPSNEIIEAYNKGTHKKGSTFSLADCHRLIDFFKDSIARHEDWKNFDFHFSDTTSYEDISGFYREVEQQGYKIIYRNVSENFVNKLVDEGKIFLFKIWNKDFSEHSKGTPNLHTLYWKMLFDEKNLANVVYKLNGQAEVFFRKRSIKSGDRIVHPANQHIANKNPLNPKTDSKFEYDIIKDRRYTVDKFQFHVPITINFKAIGEENINTRTLDTIRQGGIEHIIGIDRGERHLLYLTLIDLKGNIVKQMTLNDIANEYKGLTHHVNYKDLLQAREGERTEARQNWQTIENIKELKEGYLSQAIHIITNMMVEYKAIVVLEDLNMGFMRGRQKIERQVYEKFEKMLIDKLNLFADKQKPADSVGGILHPLQLTNFKKLGKQSGWLFYIPAWNTSKIDPVTGFTNLLDTRYHTIKEAQDFFAKFDAIRFNKTKDWFEFDLDYNNFTEKAKDTRTKWTLCTFGTRIKTFRNPQKNLQWDNQEVVLTEEFKHALTEAGIDYSSADLKTAICALKEKKDLESLLACMKLLLQMRNSRVNSEVDYLLSPVMDTDGKFYDSRNCSDQLPKDADANGAYNIARKGLLLVHRIQHHKEEKEDLAISNREWLNFVQQRPYLDE